MRFTVKHFWGSSLIAALAFVSFGIHFSALQRNWTKEQITSDLQAAVQAQTQQLSTNLSRLWRLVEILADEASAHPETIQQTLIEVRRLNPALTLLGLARADGMVTAAAGSDEITVAQAPWFENALKSPIVKAVMDEAGPSSATLVLAKPAKTKDGITVAVLFAFVPVDELVTPVASSGGWIGRSILAAHDGRQLMAWGNAELAFPSSTVSIRPNDQNEWLSATARLTSNGAFPETGWFLTVARSKAEIDQGLAPMLLRLWAGCFAMAFLTLIAATAWTAWLAAPLREISLFAKASAEGKKVDPIRETRFREAAILCISLVQLWTSLRRMNAPKTFRLVPTEAEIDGERDLIFDDLVLHINALMDQEGQIQPDAKQA